jgi:hypothetical protein
MCFRSTLQKALRTKGTGCNHVVCCRQHISCFGRLYPVAFDAVFILDCACVYGATLSLIPRDIINEIKAYASMHSNTAS